MMVPSERPPALATAAASWYAALLLVLLACSTGLMLYGYKYALVGEHNISASALALSNFAINLPLFLSFVPGVLRDRVRPFGRVDRPYLLISPLIVAGCCVLLGVANRSTGLVIGLLVLINAAAVVSMATMNAMLAMLAKRYGLSGRISAIGLLISNATSVGLLSLTGFLVTTSGFSSICFVSAGLALPIVILAFYRPASLFPIEFPSADHPLRAGGAGSIRQLISGLLVDRPARLAALICFLWDFTPGFGTPIFYRYTGELHMSPAQYEFTATIGMIGGTVSAIAYARLCFDFPPRKLLPVGAALAVVGSSGLLFVQTYSDAVIAALIAGLSAGIAKAGIYDLLYRASPRGREGAAVSLGVAATYLAGTLGDIVGSLLAESGNFSLALVLTLVTTGMIIPLVFLMPANIVSGIEGRAVERTA
jgi:MFS family permease